MKKIFLLIAIAFSFAAKAQQKELFDIDQYLQKKLQEKMDVTGKGTFIPLYQKNISGNSFSNDPSLTYTLGNGDKVITLPFDNMPCIVPDMRQFQAMPNAALGVLPGHFFFFPRNQPGLIPNAAMPFRVIIPGR